MSRMLGALAAILLSLAALPAHAAVVITFWSHELGNSFPHAFFTLRGVPDAGGEPVDLNYGFTPKTVSPAILFGPVAGRIDIAKPGYMNGSDAQFAVTLSDAQYADIRRLVTEWDDKTGDGTYRMNTRNCVHFTQEAARRAGLASVDAFPALMKKPRSFLKALAAANKGRVTMIGRHGKEYLASLPPIVPTPSAIAPAPVAVPVTAPVPVN